MRFRIPIVIPGILVALSLSFSLFVYFYSIHYEEKHIRETALNSLNRDISRLQNILYNRLTEDNYTEARLNISVTAMDPSIQTIFLADENHSIILANRYMLEKQPAQNIDRYDAAITQQVIKSNQPNIFFHKKNNLLLNGYYPVILKLESKKGLPLKRVGILFVESSIASRMASARQGATERSVVFACVMLLIAALLSLVLHNWLSRRLMKLTEASRTLSAGNLQVKARVSGNDELSELGKSFDDMVERIKGDILFRENIQKELIMLNESLEERINERTALLREAQHVAKMGYLNWNIQDDTFEWSDEIYDLFGYSVGEVEPDIKNLHSLMESQSSEVDQQMLGDVVDGKDSKCDFKIRTKDGYLRWIHCRMVPVKNKQDQVVAARGIMQDITELKVEMENRERLEKQLLQSQKMDSLGQLTGGIAHDFNNILASIIGFTSLLKRFNISDPEGKVKEYLEQISEASNRGKNLVQQMLAFGRTKEGLKEKEIVVIKDFIEETLSLLRPILPSSIKLDVNIDDSTTVIAADTDMIGQVITNLCLNARDSLTDNQGHIRIYTRNSTITDGICSSCHLPFSSNYAEICIEDNGQGISKDSISRLFEPFYTTKPVNKGSGMGLSIVHGVIHKHNGHIIVESEPGQGSRFRCFFPVIEVFKSQTDKLQSESNEENDSGHGQHLLVIDDEIPITVFLKELFTNAGYRVTAITDSRQAMEYFKGFHSNIDLVITDQTMPGLTGIQLSEKMLEIDSSIPVIICTGFSEQITNELLKQENIADIMQKPVDDDKLLEKVKDTLSASAKSQPGKIS